MGRDGRPDPAFWQNRSVFVTGHTGFVGGWLVFWLSSMGARVHGYSLPPPTTPNFFEAAGLGALVTSTLADIRAAASLRSAITAAKPDILFHLAAQPLVGASYSDPIETFAVNVSGTANVLAAIADTASLTGAIIVTTDKVYEQVHGTARYREDDALGGHSPYSLSKAGAELAVTAFRNSKLMRQDLGLATARIGNILGGGDWASDRLVPDAVRAFSNGRPLMLRMPKAVRPWQHVLDAVCGLLLLGERSCIDPVTAAGAWNLGPANPAAFSVEDVVKSLAQLWGRDASYRCHPEAATGEVSHLQIDSRKAARILGWQTSYSFEDVIRMTAIWYRAFYQNADMRSFSIAQIEKHEAGGQFIEPAAETHPANT